MKMMHIQESIISDHHRTKSNSWHHESKPRGTTTEADLANKNKTEQNIRTSIPTIVIIPSPSDRHHNAPTFSDH